MNAQERQCRSCASPFVIAPEDFDFYKKINVPPPTWCPECRLKRRLAHYSKRTLYKRDCGMCAKSMFSMYHASNPIKVYCNTCWWSDKWDALQYGVDYDPSRPFLAQVKELLQVVPWMALGVNQPTLVNSEYCNAAGGLKNCYLVFYADIVEDSYYSDTIVNSKDCFDCYLTGHSERCFQCVNITKCSRAYFCTDCDESYDIYFSRDLVGCSDCFGCVNLRKKQYQIFNEQYSKEEYFKKLSTFDLSTQEGIKNVQEQMQALSLGQPHKYMHGYHNANVTGDYAEHSKNTANSFLIENVEDSKYCLIMYLRPTKDCYDYCFYGDNATRIYESIKSGGDISDLKFCNGCWPSNRALTYATYCISSNNLFGCVGLRNKSYCILNKQYSKEEYEKLSKEIMADMEKYPYIDGRGLSYSYGEFYPVEFSPFAYNETIAQEFFPSTKARSEQEGYRWFEAEKKIHKATKKGSELPASINDIPDSVLDEVIQCGHNGECDHQCSIAFRVIPQELALYRKMKFALPGLCSNCRHYERLGRTNPIKLWTRKCQCQGSASPHLHGATPCPNEFETSYAPDCPEIIYCEACYNAEVV